MLTVLEGFSRWSILKELDEGKSLIDVNIWSVLLGDGVKVAPFGSAAIRFVYSSVRTSWIWMWGGLFSAASWKGHWGQLKMIEVTSSKSSVLFPLIAMTEGATETSGLVTLCSFGISFLFSEILFWRFSFPHRVVFV